MPRLDLACRLVDCPAPDLDNQSGIFEDVQKGRRREQSFARVAPAQQGLGADHPEIVETHDRLVVQHEFAVIEGPPELVGQRIAPGRQPGQRRLPGDRLAGTQRLGALQGDVEIAQRIGLVALRRGHCHIADAGGQAQRQVADADRPLHDAQDPLSKPRRFHRRQRRRPAKDAELVGPQPRDHVARAHLRRRLVLPGTARPGAGDEALGGDPQHPVADPDPVQIVDVAKAADVDREDRDLAALRIRVGPYLPQSAGEFMAVGKPGQPVRHRLQHVFAGERMVLAQRNDDPGDDAIRIAVRSRAEYWAPRFAAGIIVQCPVMLDVLAGEGAQLHLLQCLGAGLVELAVAAAGKRRRRETEGTRPGCAGGNIAQVAVEQRNCGRDLAQELGAPIGCPVRFGTHARRHRVCGSVRHRTDDLAGNKLT